MTSRFDRWTAAVVAVLLSCVVAWHSSEAGARDAAPRQILPPEPPHVPELADYLDRLELSKPLVHGELAVFPVVRRGDAPLRGRWLTMDAAIKRGVLVVTEQGDGGTVPVIQMANRSRDQHVFVMSGEVVAGGKQTRTIRRDVALAPGQKIDVSVFCVEAHRWAGEDGFAAADVVVPQSIQKQLRSGTSQEQVWAEVARSNEALGSRNATASLEQGLKAKPVRARLKRVSSSIVPKVPRSGIGFIFVHRHRAVGAEFFGRTDLAAALLPKLLDAYAVDLVLQQKATTRIVAPPKRAVAQAFLARIKRAGSTRSDTPGSGAGIRTRAAGLVGEGISLGDALVHFGVQIEERLVPQPPIKPMPQRPATRQR